MAYGRFFDGAGGFKGRADRGEILAVDEERFVGLPDAAAVFQDSTVLHTGVLARIFGTHIRQMEGSVFIVVHADQQYLSIQFVELCQGGGFAENIGKIVVFCQVFRMLSPGGERAGRMIASYGSGPRAEKRNFLSRSSLY